MRQLVPYGCDGLTDMNAKGAYKCDGMCFCTFYFGRDSNGLDPLLIDQSLSCFEDLASAISIFWNRSS